MGRGKTDYELKFYGGAGSRTQDASEQASRSEGETKPQRGVIPLHHTTDVESGAYLII